MKYIIGYQPASDMDSTYELARDFHQAVSGVYFALPGSRSARSPVDPKWEAEMFEELAAIQALGAKLIMLYNANCYGARAAAPAFRDQIVRDVERACQSFDLASVTTASPFVARVIKESFPKLHVTASVNMGIGSISAMELLSNFDGFYLKREHLYDFPRIRSMKAWCDRHGKQLKLLANSGCLYDCPFHTYHDNLVAHEGEGLDGPDNPGHYISPCWEAMSAIREEEAAALFLRGNWIRPEDMKAYEPYFSEAKLATRAHDLPRRVVRAYGRGHCAGNLFDLTEPAFSARFGDSILDADRIPTDYFDRRASCGRRCDACDYCLHVAREALHKKADLERAFMRDS